jgi:sugar phosphate isomerase/epimerase
MPTPLTDLTRCAIHSFTTKPLDLEQAVAAYAAAGVHGISVWRQHLEPYGPERAARILRDAGMTVPAYVRGGFFTGDPAARQAALDDNKRCLDEAAAIGADQVVLVVGATPGLPLAEARKQVQDGIATCLDHARQLGVRLAIEPLHPMYAGDKSCVTSLRQAREIWQALGDPLVGVAVDVYHVWFDQDLAEELRLAGADQRIFGFHVCDWKCDTSHLLLDRGLMGEGCIDIRGIRSLVEDAGFNGWIEVEIFSSTHWAKTQSSWLKEITAAYLAQV